MTRVSMLLFKEDTFPGLSHFSENVEVSRLNPFFVQQFELSRLNSFLFQQIGLSRLNQFFSNGPDLPQNICQAFFFSLD